MSAGPARRGRTAAPRRRPRSRWSTTLRSSATVVEVRAHDEPGLLWRIGRALGECGLNVQAARVETLGAEAVDVFYVTDATGGLLTDPDLRKRRVVASGTVRAQFRFIRSERTRLTSRGFRLRGPQPPGPGSLEVCLRRSPIG